MPPTRPLALAALLALAPATALAQTPPPVFAPTGHPDHVPTTAPLADVRAFAVARAGNRGLVAYVQAADPHARGALRLASVHALPDGGGLARDGADRTLAPSAQAVAVWWNGERGAVAYTVPRPHRGEPPGRRGHADPVAASREPLGRSALTAGDVVLQAIDAQGAPVGRPVTVFEENGRAFRVAVARDGDAWLVAWTGAIGTDDEVRGTVRFSRVDDAGNARAVATDTGFTGEVGDALVLVPARAPSRPSPVVLWTGQRCASHPDLPPLAPPAADPSAAIEPRARTLMPQQPPHELDGPPIECGAPRIYATLARANGATSPLFEGPVVASDAVDVVEAREGPMVLAAVAGPPRALALYALDAQGRTAPRPARTVSAQAAAQAATPASTTHPPATEGPPPSTQLTPSRVPPPDAPGPDAIARTPTALHASSSPDSALALVALSPTRARLVYGTAPAAGGALSLALLAPPGPATTARAWDVALAADPHGAGGPWVFVQTGELMGGPLVFVDGASASLHAAQPEVPWAGDERLREHLVAARVARAADTAAEAVWGPLRERPDWATNTALPGIESNLRRLRGRWDAACQPLLERARWLARHGVDASVVDLAREVCEMPPDPSLGVPPQP